MPAIHWIKRNANVLFFIGGFIFDSLTMTRIDSTLDLVWQLGYMGIITVLMVAQVRQTQGRWTPSGKLARYWEYETEALHFCYGGLLSGFVVFYFKSTSFSRSLVFLSLIAVLMLANEMPQVRKWGTHVRLGLYAFCVVSYLNYLLPVLIGRMGWPIFILGWIIASVLTFQVMKMLARYADNPAQAFSRFTVSPTIVLVLIMGLYMFKLIPPVPLSLRHLGIYRLVEKDGDRYRLVSRAVPWYRFWKTDNREFPARAGDEIYSFISVFGPRGFTHKIFIRWYVRDVVKKEWLTADRFPIPLTGGRADGFRGYMKKENFSPGHYRVDVETEDGRVLGSKSFEVTEDVSTEARPMRAGWM
jgi:hypothetical protein